MEFIKLMISVILFLLSGLAGYNIYRFNIFDKYKYEFRFIMIWILSNTIVINMTAIYILWRI